VTDYGESLLLRRWSFTKYIRGHLPGKEHLTRSFQSFSDLRSLGLLLLNWCLFPSFPETGTGGMTEYIHMPYRIHTAVPNHWRGFVMHVTKMDSRYFLTWCIIISARRGITSLHSVHILPADINRLGVKQLILTASTAMA